MSSIGEFDVGPLSWVKGEIDQALGRAVAALRAFATNPEDRGQIKTSRTHFHQAHGALQIVGLDGVARFSEELEGLLVDVEANKAEASAIGVAERGASAISTYLEQLLAGQPNQPLKLYALYREVAAARGKPVPDPVDLFFPDLTKRLPKHDGMTASGIDRAAALKSGRSRFMRGLLRWLRGDREGMREIHAATAIIEEAEVIPSARTFWWATRGLFEGVSAGALTDELGVPRLCNRVERQIKRLIDGVSSGVAERLQREILFHIARAQPVTDTLREIQSSLGLVGSIPETFELAADDAALLPRLRALREAIQAAKGSWTKFTAGHLQSIASFADHAAQLRDRAAVLGRVELTRLAEEISAIGEATKSTRAAPSESVAIEVATALLLSEDAVERYSALPPEFGQQCQAMIARLRSARGERSVEVAAASPLLDEMSRRAQERVAIAQLVGEIQSNLREIESGLDTYFRDQSRPEELTKLDKPISQVLGAFRILNEVKAEAALVDCVDRIHRFTAPGAQPEDSEFEHIAGVLSGLGFYVDALQHGKADFELATQPIRPKVAPVEESIPAAPSVEAQLEQHQRDTQSLVEAWQANPEDLGKKEELRQHVESLQQDAVLVADVELERKTQETLSLLSKSEDAAVEPQLAQALEDLKPEMAPVIAPSAETKQLAESSNEAIDAELLEVYIEEAGEVVMTIREQLAIVRAQPTNGEALRTIRRGFHTLKGSGRMVGLMRLGDAAWAVEKLLNGWLEAERPGVESLFGLIDEGQQLFGAAVDALKARRALPDETALVAKAQALESGESVVVIGERRLTPALYEIFLGESRSHVGTLQAMLARLEDGDQVNEDDVRAAHTLGGVCGSVGFTSIRDVAQALETALGRMVDLRCDPEQRHLLTLAIDALESTVNAVAKKTEPAAYPAIVEQLQALRFAEPQPPVVAAVGLDVAADDELELHDFRVGEEVRTAPDTAFVAATTPAIEEMASSVPPADALDDDAAFAEHLARVDLEFADKIEPPQPFTPAARESDALEMEIPAERSFSDEPATPPTVAVTPAENKAPPIEVPAAVALASALAPATLWSRSTLESDDIDSVKPSVTTAPAETSGGEEIDPQLLELFIEEAQELVPTIASSLREWRQTPTNPAAGHALQRYLHTLKGSARMAGAMNLGEILHDMETRVENAISLSPLPITLFDDLEIQFDRASTLFERLNAPDGAEEIPLPEAPVAAESELDSSSAPIAANDPDVSELEDLTDVAADEGLATVSPREVAAVPRRQAAFDPRPATTADTERAAVLRVRADTVDRLVNQAGEVAIARSRIEGEVKTLKSSLGDLTENINRLRGQLREIEIQAETAIQSKMVQASDESRDFDPLEFDRFTRFQELTRMLAESVSDVASVHQNLARSLDETDAALLAQSRMSRDLQQDLLRVRMVPFKNISERLYRVVRQAAKESGKRATLDIRGSQTELDRSVLERITAPFEHMIRNCVAHGLESPSVRRAAGKTEAGEVRLEIRQEGNEVMLAVSDDGAGLDLDRIRAKAIERGLIDTADQPTEAELAEIIFQPGFTTASEVTQLAGRGVGMDVVKSEVNALGGRVEVSSERSKGARFVVYLPLTLAVTQAVLVSGGPATFAIPGLLIEQVRQMRADELAECYRTRVATLNNRKASFHYLPRLLGDAQSVPEAKRLAPVIFVRSGNNMVAVHVDEMIGNQEIVVKNTGPLLARVAGVTGATVLGSGEIVLIINPVIVAGRELSQDAVVATPVAREMQPGERTVMIVDDSLTVRKITGRLLQREGYSVLSARDGVDAIEQLEEALPDLMVVDIEMPRMDGFDLTRNVRASPRLQHVPIVMVTSRTADKHRNYAMEIGVNAFLGKPYRDDELLATISGLIANAPRATVPA